MFRQTLLVRLGRIWIEGTLHVSLHCVQKTESVTVYCSSFTVCYSLCTSLDTVEYWCIQCKQFLYSGVLAKQVLQYTVSCIMCIVYSQQFPCTFSTVSTPACLLWSVQWTVYTVHCRVYTVECTRHCVHCTLKSVNCRVYTPLCILYTPACLLHLTPGFRNLLGDETGWLLYCTVYCTVLHCTLNCTALYTALYHTLHCTVLHCTLHCAALYNAQCTVLDCTLLCTPHCTALYTKLYTKLYNSLYSTV